MTNFIHTAYYREYNVVNKELEDASACFSVYLRLVCLSVPNHALMQIMRVKSTDFAEPSMLFFWFSLFADNDDCSLCHTYTNRHTNTHTNTYTHKRKRGKAPTTQETNKMHKQVHKNACLSLFSPFSI